MNRNEVGSFGIGLGVGLLAGAVLGLLFAPQSGKETRTLIKDKAEDLGAKVRGIVGKGTLTDVKPK